MKVIHTTAIALLFVFINTTASGTENRGYDPEMLTLGKSTYQTNCAVCHGDNAQGTVTDWQKRDENGKFPPPPLNGTAHTWHHPIGGLAHTIKNGTISMGGTMPPWKDKLSDKEIFAVIMWLSSLWPDEIYGAWLQRNNN